ncbi:MAG: ABC transporter permease [Chloroflexi bacterium]|nr:MAG: ABC transporter permease [Chloroflexota bacterium]
MRRVPPPLISVALAVMLVAAWKAWTVWFHVSDLLVPPPESVGRGLLALATKPSTAHHAAVTLYEIVAGFLAALAAGLVVGTALGRSPQLQRTLNPFLVALQVTPKIALVPILIVWLGFGAGTKIVTAAIFAFLPLVTGTIAGVRAVDPNHRDLLLSLRARRWAAFRMLELPSALPSILTGMEVGIVLATVGALVGEYLGGEEGLGYLAVQALNQLDVAGLFALIALLCLLGYVLFAAVTALRAWLIPWHHSVRAIDPSVEAAA